MFLILHVHLLTKIGARNDSICSEHLSLVHNSYQDSWCSLKAKVERKC